MKRYLKNNYENSFNLCRKYKMAPRRHKVCLSKTDTIDSILRQIGSERIYNLSTQRAKTSASFPEAQRAVSNESYLLAKLANLLEKKGY